MRRPKTSRTLHPERLEPDRFAKALSELESADHAAFHSQEKIKQSRTAIRKYAAELQRASQARARAPGPGPARSKKTKALVVIGQITGWHLIDTAFINTANEAHKDLRNRGYDTALLQNETRDTIEKWLADTSLKAFCFVGHGGGKGDSGDSHPENPKNANDTLWLNKDEVIGASDAQRWRHGAKTDVVILHACYQGRKHTSARWQKAFGVSAKNYHSWFGPCRFFQAFWWQVAWK